MGKLAHKGGNGGVKQAKVAAVQKPLHAQLGVKGLQELRALGAVGQPIWQVVAGGVFVTVQSGLEVTTVVCKQRHGLLHVRG